MVSGCRSPGKRERPVGLSVDFSSLPVESRGCRETSGYLARRDGDERGYDDFQKPGAITFSKSDYRGVRTEEYRVRLVDVRVVSFPRT